MKFWKKSLMLFSTVLVSTFIYGWYLYNKKPADVRLQKSAMEIKATDLLLAFKRDEVGASKKYVGKIITVAGTIKHVDFSPPGMLTICLAAGDPSSGIVCSFYHDELRSMNNTSVGKSIKVKGICTGILMDVVLNKCSMVD